MKILYSLFFIFSIQFVNAQEIKREFFQSGALMHEGGYIKDQPVGLHKYFYENGALRSNNRFDRNGLWKSFVEYDQWGNVTRSMKFSSMNKGYPRRNFSNIQWSKISKDVYIYNYNKVNTNYILTDSTIITMRYICYTESGKILDNNYESTCPFNFPISSLVVGFQEGIKAIQPGETALIKILPDKAFGKLAKGNVPANSTLIYHVELLKVE